VTSVSKGRSGRTVPAAYFRDLYRGTEDPWGFAVSAYERDKYAATLEALPHRRYGAALETGIGERLGLRRRLSAVSHTRSGIGQRSMVHTDATPVSEVDPERAAALRARFPGRLEVITADATTYLPEEPCDLTVIDVDLALEFDLLLDDLLLRITNPGGVIITNIVQDFFSGYHGHEAMEEVYFEEPECAVLLKHFGHLLLTDTRIKAAYREQANLEPLITAEKWASDPNNIMGWTAFRAGRVLR